jgi:hypothetical protein
VIGRYLSRFTPVQVTTGKRGCNFIVPQIAELHQAVYCFGIVISKVE